MNLLKISPSPPKQERIVKRPFTQLPHLRDLIRQFTPNWFTVTMGTGVVALIVSELPIFPSLTWHVGTALWIFNSILFVLFSLLYVLRWVIYTQEAKQIFKHPMMSLFLGAIPMGLATIINGFLKYGEPLWGINAVQFAEQLWYIDVVIAVLVAWIVPFAMFQKQEHQLQGMTAVWLLPIVACEVAASSGGLLIGHLNMDMHAVTLMFLSYVLWGISVLPAFAILTILMLRLILHKIPEKQLAISSWLALGPIGTGALALLVLGQQAPELLASVGYQHLGVLFHDAGIMVSFVLLGFGLWWLGIAVMTTIYHLRKELPFNLGWWGLTFPLGVFTLAILNLAQQLNVPFIFDIAYTFMTCLIMLWLIVAYRTAKGFYHGELLFSPCLKMYLERSIKYT